MSSFSEIFFLKPKQWGLRGDEFLWAEMEVKLALKPFPKNVEKALVLLQKTFEKLTGKPISTADHFFVERYSHGGMSSGSIDPEFWRSHGIPCLLQNLTKILDAQNCGTYVMQPAEKTLDKAIEEAFKTNPDFVRWFIAKTKFSSEQLSYLWSRSDNPWGRFKFDLRNEVTGEIETFVRESETDVLVVLENESGKRFALHIENKLKTGSFTKHQVDMYAVRAKKWQGRPKYQNYEEWETVLIAHSEFIERNHTDSSKFGCVVRHEEIAAFVPQFTYGFL